MNTFVIFALLFACAVAAPEGGLRVSQDTAGNFQVAYDFEDAKAKETARADGTVVGFYEFVDKDGIAHRVQYKVDADGGYYAEGDVPKDTPAIAAVKLAHLAKVEKLRSILPALPADEQ